LRGTAPAERTQKSILDRQRIPERHDEQRLARLVRHHHFVVEVEFAVPNLVRSQIASIGDRALPRRKAVGQILALAVLSDYVVVTVKEKPRHSGSECLVTDGVPQISRS